MNWLSQVVLKKNESTDYQKHLLRDEEITILLGTGSYVLGDEEKQFMEGDTIFIPRNTPYRFRADRETHMWKIPYGVCSKDDTIKLKDELRK